MERCVVCGNASDSAFRIVFSDGASYVLDSFECAIQALAPECEHCRCRIIGHGIERGGSMFCSEHCARVGPEDAADEPPALS